PTATRRMFALLREACRHGARGSPGVFEKRETLGTNDWHGAPSLEGFAHQAIQAAAGAAGTWFSARAPRGCAIDDPCRFDAGRHQPTELPLRFNWCKFLGPCIRLLFSSARLPSPGME